MNERRPAGWLVDGSLVVMTLIWGVTFVIVKRALADASTLLFLTIRFGTAAFVLALIFRSHFRKDLHAGNLGMSLLNQADSVEVDFGSMTLTLK